jgi:hypothetical protein
MILYMKNIEPENAIGFYSSARKYMLTGGGKIALLPQFARYFCRRRKQCGKLPSGQKQHTAAFRRRETCVFLLNHLFANPCGEERRKASFAPYRRVLARRSDPAAFPSTRCNLRVFPTMILM